MEEFCRRFSDAYTSQQNGLAERFNQTILESMQTILHYSGIRKNLWTKILSASILTLNQIPAHRSEKSPYELFKVFSIPLDFFQPIGNPVSVYAQQVTGKLDPRGEIGKLLGFNADLKSYRILMNDGRIINSKNVEKMIPHPPEDEDETSASQSNETDNFESSKESLDDDDDVILRERTLQVKPVKRLQVPIQAHGSKLSKES
ncbi:hypothetical protein VP01_9124g1 [Puccinia sorghi]|uniref:Integrase catalytic domain-containing protein n=1 Tax=Puccinia sorghi TaxID=27349 RepID=A0A0L6U7K1_9BASI|nr:hypothetical protein VP01_9124g1 [Puccinia sorghi]